MQIKELKIYSSNIRKQSDFYTKLLGLTIINDNDHKVSFKIGKSILTIEYKAQTTPYHFAINIPSNKELEALNWLKSKVEILKNGTHEIQEFDFWNAKAIYFYDQDKNIVELIARKNLNNNSNQKFDNNQFLEISEIGIATLNIERDFNQLNNLTGIEVFDGDFERFCAIGDENGLFICINKKIKNWFPTQDKAISSEFEIQFFEKKIAYHLEYKNENIKSIKNL